MSAGARPCFVKNIGDKEYITSIFKQRQFLLHLAWAMCNVSMRARAGWEGQISYRWKLSPTGGGPNRGRAQPGTDLSPSPNSQNNVSRAPISAAPPASQHGSVANDPALRYTGGGLPGYSLRCR